MRVLALSLVLFFAACAIAAAAESAPAPLDPALAEHTEGEDTLWFDARQVGLEGQLWEALEQPYDRLPASAKGVVREPVWKLGQHSAGLAVRFFSDSPSIQARWTLRNEDLAMNHMAATGVSGLDLYARHEGAWRWVAVGRPKEQSNEAVLVQSAPEGMQEYLLYLPLYNGTESLKIGIDRGAALAPAPPRPRPPVVFYGTSITQGGCAARPGMAYPAILGRWLDVETANLGFSGNGEMDPELAELLGGIEASVYVLDCLPNMQPDMIKERYASFVQRLRALRPDTPILLVDHIVPTNLWFSASRSEGIGAKAAAHDAALQELKDLELPGLHEVDGSKLLGEDSEATVDGVHPTDLGFLRIAEAIRPVLEPLTRQSK